MCINKNTKRCLSFFDIDFAVVIGLLIQVFILVVIVAFFGWSFCGIPCMLCFVTAIAIWRGESGPCRLFLFGFNVITAIL